MKLTSDIPANKRKKYIEIIASIEGIQDKLLGGEGVSFEDDSEAVHVSPKEYFALLLDVCGE